ncbi:UNVERIFIED_CONTAM: hypothetical protein K2H54_073359 [Gekko kuhli]
MHRAGLLLLVGLLAFWAEISPGSSQKTPVEKAGTCPALIQWPDQMCGLFCSTDRNCPAEEKCCRTRCSHECRRPSESIPGYCPKGTLPPNTATTCLARCSTDQSCRENGHPGKKCCAYGCQLRCTEPVEEVCKLPMDSGPCLALVELYYYDRASRTCKKFVYGGCRGNGNRFSTRTECMMVCGNRGKG